MGPRDELGSVRVRARSLATECQAAAGVFVLPRSGHRCINAAAYVTERALQPSNKRLASCGRQFFAIADEAEAPDEL